MPHSFPFHFPYLPISLSPFPFLLTSHSPSFSLPPPLLLPPSSSPSPSLPPFLHRGMEEGERRREREEERERGEREMEGERERLIVVVHAALISNALRTSLPTNHSRSPNKSSSARITSCGREGGHGASPWGWQLIGHTERRWPNHRLLKTSRTPKGYRPPSYSCPSKHTPDRKKTHAVIH